MQYLSVYIYIYVTSIAYAYKDKCCIKKHVSLENLRNKEM